MELRSVTGHQSSNATICLRTRDGVNVAGDFQIAPKDTGLQRSIIPVGQVCDRGNIITFRSTGGTILDELSGNRIEFQRAGGGVYWLSADTRAKMKSGTGGVQVFMGFDQDTAVAAEPQLPSEAKVEHHKLTQFPFRNWCRHCVRAFSKESPHHESSPGGVSKFATHLFVLG